MAYGKTKYRPRRESLAAGKKSRSIWARGLRTAQRYAHELDLPVRRPSGHRSGSVIASKRDLNSWVRSSATGQECFNRDTRTILAYLSAELAKGPHQRALQKAMIRTLRKELRKRTSRIQEDIAELRRQLNDATKRQNSHRLGCSQDWPSHARTS